MTVTGAADNATVTRVSSSASSVTLKAANGGRRTLSIFNESGAILYVKYGTTASATDYTVQIAAGAYFENPQPCFRGRIDGIWASADGAAQITEGY